MRGLQTEVLVAPVLRRYRGVKRGGGTNNPHVRPLCLRGCGPPKATVPGPVRVCVCARRSTGRGSAADVINTILFAQTTRCSGSGWGHGGAGCTIFSGIISLGPALGAEPSGVATSCRQLVENPAKNGELEGQHQERTPDP